MVWSRPSPLRWRDQGRFARALHIQARTYSAHDSPPSHHNWSFPPSPAGSGAVSGGLAHALSLAPPGPCEMAAAVAASRSWAKRWLRPAVRAVSACPRPALPCSPAAVLAQGKGPDREVGVESPFGRATGRLGLVTPRVSCSSLQPRRESSTGPDPACPGQARPPPGCCAAGGGPYPLSPP